MAGAWRVLPYPCSRFSFSWDLRPRWVHGHCGCIRQLWSKTCTVLISLGFCLASSQSCLQGIFWVRFSVASSQRGAWYSRVVQQRLSRKALRGPQGWGRWRGTFQVHIPLLPLGSGVFCPLRASLPSAHCLPDLAPQPGPAAAHPGELSAGACSAFHVGV